MGTQDSKFGNPQLFSDAQFLKKTIDGKDCTVRWLGHTSTDYRRSHAEVFVPLKAGEKVYSIPVPADLQGTITKIRIRSRSEKVKFTLTDSDVYTADNLDPHPRHIVYQITTDSKDFTSDEDFIYYHKQQYSSEVPTLYASIENLGADSDGVSVVITFGY